MNKEFLHKNYFLIVVKNKNKASLLFHNNRKQFINHVKNKFKKANNYKGKSSL